MPLGDYSTLNKLMGGASNNLDHFHTSRQSVIGVLGGLGVVQVLFHGLGGGGSQDNN